MNNITHAHKNMSRTGVILGGMALTILSISLFGIQSAFAEITSSLDIGSQGSQVTELQSYLSTDASLYPSGLITGYYGSLTQGGVQKFQVVQGIVSAGTPATTGYGRVGPVTMAHLNTAMGSVGQASSDTSPILSAPLVQNSNTTATFLWTTNEATQGQVYWSTSPILSYEATGPRQLPYVSGTLAIDAGGLQTNHTVTVSNLQPNTTYYYLVRAIDNVGNMSMVLPRSFHTAQ